MDAAMADWTAGHSPRRAMDLAGEELAQVDRWLDDSLPDIGDDEIVKSLADFDDHEFFHDSPPVIAPLPQQSGSTEPTSSSEGPSSSGAVCGGTPAAPLSRLGAFRSFSTNDLQLLLEPPPSMYPPVTGLSAPAPYGGHVGLASLKSKTRPLLESVPEGAPSPGVPLPLSSSLPASLSMAAPSGGLASSPVAGFAAAAFLPPALPDLGHAAATASAQGGNPAAATTPVGSPSAAAPQTQLVGTSPPLLQQQQLAASPVPPVGLGLRHVPSTGTLSTMIQNTLQFQAEGSGESPQKQHALQHPQAPQQSPPPQQQLLPPPQLQPPATQAAALQGTVLAGLDPTGLAQPQQQPQPLPQQPHVALSSSALPAAVSSSVPPAAGFDSMVAAAKAVAAAAMFPLPLPPQQHSGTLSGLYGVPSHHLSPAGSLPLGAFHMGLPMQQLSSHLMANSPSPSPQPNLAAAVAAANTAAGEAGGASGIAANGANGSGSGGDTHGSGACSGSGPRLRKCQSALELGSWRAASVAPETDAGIGGGFGAPGMVPPAGQKLIGRLTPEERLQRILRYRHKRNLRNYNREVKYQCRKTLADSRPRVGGRFARNDDPHSVLPHQTKKALRIKGQTAASAVAAAAMAAVAAAAAGGTATRGPNPHGNEGSGVGAVAVAAVQGEPKPQLAGTGAGGDKLPPQTQEQQLLKPAVQTQQQQRQVGLQRSASGFTLAGGTGGAPVTGMGFGITGGGQQMFAQTAASSVTTITATTTTSSANTASSDAHQQVAVTSGGVQVAAGMMDAPGSSPPASLNAGTNLAAYAVQAAAAAALSSPPPPPPVTFSAGSVAGTSAAADATAAAALFPGGFPYSYATPTLPYISHSMLSSSPAAAGAAAVMPQPPGLAAPGAWQPGLGMMSAVQLQHHYAIVNAAAQAAAQDVYAHLGLVHGNAHANSHAAFAGATAAAAAAPQMPQQGLSAPQPVMPLSGGYSAYNSVSSGAARMTTAAAAAMAELSAALSMNAGANASQGTPAATAMAAAAAPPVDAPPRISTPFIDELLSHMDSELAHSESLPLAPAVPMLLPGAATPVHQFHSADVTQPMVLPEGAVGGFCMVVDG